MYAPNWWQRAIRSGTGQAIRWLAVLGLLLWRWTVGWPSAAKGWVPVIVIALLLLLPDADSIAFGGVKIEMRRAREEIAGLRQQIAMLSMQAQRQGQSQHVHVDTALMRDRAVTSRAAASAFAETTEGDEDEDINAANLGSYLRRPAADVDPSGGNDVPSGQ